MFRNRKLYNKIRNTIFIFICSVVFTVTVPLQAHASYMLPYPSYMPGNKMYRIAMILDQLKRYWYWGNIAQIKYHMELSDKYLVEAKTLMEYNQYLLATDALVRSDKEFIQLPKYMKGAKSRHVDITRYKQLTTEAGQKHNEVLAALVSLVPSEFTWTPEKAKATDLKLKDMLNSSIQIRNNVINKIVSL